VANRTHDFDIVLGEEIVALEITSAVAGEVRAMWDAIGRADFDAPMLKQSWTVTLSAAGPGRPGPDVRRVAKEAPALVRQLEEVGFRQFDEVHSIDHEHAAAARDALLALGVRSGSAAGDPPRGATARLQIGTVGPGGTEDPEPLVLAVEEAAQANAAKLLAADPDGGHLFLWVDSTNSACEVPMVNPTIIPARVPELPSGVHTVWTATWARGATTLWRATPPQAWERLPVPHLPSYAAAITSDDSVLRAESEARDAVGRSLGDRD
jgi:hypothetical protein